MNLQDYRYDVDYTTLMPRFISDTKYDLFDPAQRQLYFNAKIGDQLTSLREYVKNNSFVAYFMAPKQAGKGTYTNMLTELLGKEYIENISVGDLVRDADIEYAENGKKSDLYAYFKKNYRGFVDVDKVFDSLGSRSSSNLLETDFILTLIKRKIDSIGRKTVFIDGFPRKADQVSYSLYFRDLINYRNDPDVFVLINLPLQIIDDRIKGRRVCPKCKLSKNITLNPTQVVKFDKDNNPVLVCDNPECDGEILVEKEGDNLGIQAIKERIENDLDLTEMARKMYGIPRIELYNSIETSLGEKYANEYELTPVTTYSQDKDGSVKRDSELYTCNDHGKAYYSFVPGAMVAQLIKHLADLFVPKN
ncbi:MAG TPA: hypothetical protein PLX79_03285 [Candidatus Dojkabacteria bacterium]|nr:hypothetical protein [Candidatus Dojkabacteria bacterium]